MRYALDIVFLSKDMKVVRIYRNLKPWRATRIVWGATQVLEVVAGKLPENINIGDEVEICTN